METKKIESSDGEESTSSSVTTSHSKSNIQSFTPLTPTPPAGLNYRTSKRRKGVPHRAPLGGVVVIQA